MQKGDKMIRDIIFLIIGFILLIKGADLFVEGSSSVAKLLKVPTIIIGLTIVAMGTSAPEAAVSISAALKGQNAIAIANVVGSNIFNLLIVGGVCAVITPIIVKKSIIKREYPFSIIISILLLFFISDFIFGNNNITLGRLEGLILLVLFVLFIIYMVVSAIKNREELDEDFIVLSPTKSILYILLGLLGVIYGGDAVVDSASSIASSLGLSANLIGLTIIALGTSLPELVTSIVAARKGDSDMALGNIIGSNIFNILLILGMASFIHPIAVSMESVFDLIILCIVSIITYFFCISKDKISKKEGFVMILMYLIYMIYIINR
ncbi:K+-dependent Na+/Ca+ exchanger family protein [Anaerofustis stercorihominis DSM 17244]|uniref:K+-dependent Na+/Ca+ exchanger family protein n=2 Tax=Anaerofustis stercorihominis TaxID=214853 RepID=B1C9Q8_9FIRM|nr:K+-dependent Na+/Ca+ exchanger family protein [Anaerofustis stercorihominis DSM 17244]